MPRSAQHEPDRRHEARYRRDAAMWRTRRLSWLIGAVAATATAALGAVFSQLLPGHTASASTTSRPSAPGPAPAQQAGSQSATPPASPRASATVSQARPVHTSKPTPVPAPTTAAPVVVSGGS
jgi:hypothetical protein